MILTYILDEQHRPVPCEDPLVWAEWLAKSGSRHVARAEVTADVWVSTIFLAVDHNFLDEDHPPLLFETMVFGGAMNHFQERYCTWADAELGHKRILAQVVEVEELERMSK